MTTMTVDEARNVLASIRSGKAEAISTLTVLRAWNVLWQVRDPRRSEIPAMIDELERRRHIDAQGLLPIQPKLSARLKAITEKQPDPPTFPAPGMTYGFRECPNWPEYRCWLEYERNEEIAAA